MAASAPVRRFVGRLMRQKGMLDLVQTVLRAAEIDLHIVGEVLVFGRDAGSFIARLIESYTVPGVGLVAADRRKSANQGVNYVRILVTGGAGFIGANLSRELTSAGHEVAVLDDLSTGVRSNLTGVPVHFVEGTILSPESCQDAVAGCEAVVHLAAIPSVPRSVKDPVSTHAVNATGTLNVLEAARSVASHVVVASSSSVYGANPDLPKREDAWIRPLSPYAVSKLATEAYAIAYQSSFGLSTIAFRFFNVYGPLQAAGHAYAAVVPAFLDAALRGEPLTIQGDGEQTRDFTFIDTVCQVLSTAVTQRVSSPQPVNLALGTRSSVNDLADLVATEVGGCVERVHTSPRVGDIRDSQAAGDRLRALFPDVQARSLRDGVARTAEWMSRTAQGTHGPASIERNAL